MIKLKQNVRKAKAIEYKNKQKLLAVNSKQNKKQLRHGIDDFMSNKL